MDDQTRHALSRGHRIDMTTTGRRSGQPRRIEIVFHNFGGRLYISGTPRADRKRAWLLNLEADPHFTFHLTGAHPVDLPATARVITDEAERRAVLVEVARAWNRDDIDTMVRDSPLIEVTLDELAA
ncbi:MAG TPA: nitroreductase family deazaflavin-dependent oxidoreductase [Candidatus Limnocylindrales bacterium]|jgi:deazaflavin-dependent oxidoreductase (nitroreductase family)|nr:nitroreductase family deazaflavin-dependent oxidoreductase [Candidatus Limnocylindrales bacterium]